MHNRMPHASERDTPNPPSLSKLEALVNSPPAVVYEGLLPVSLQHVTLLTILVRVFLAHLYRS